MSLLRHWLCALHVLVILGREASFERLSESELNSCRKGSFLLEEVAWRLVERLLEHPEAERAVRVVGLENRVAQAFVV